MKLKANYSLFYFSFLILKKKQLFFIDEQNYWNFHFQEINEKQ